MKQINLIRKDVLVHAAIRYPLTEMFPQRQNGKRDFQAFDEDQLVKFAKRFVGEKGIHRRGELQKADMGLYLALSRRNLVEAVKLDEKLRDWTPLSDEDLVRFAKAFIAERGISGRKELEKTDSGLYHALGRRKLMDSVGLGKKQRDWVAMRDDELVLFAKTCIAEKKISGASELDKADPGLCRTLRNRDLLGMIGLERKIRSWAGMSDEELVLFAKTFIEENGIRFRSGLETADMSLYLTLGRRKLMDAVGFEETRRDWKSLSDEELVGFARAFIAEKSVGGRKELLKADLGLYGALRRRKLLDAAFSVLEQSNMLEAVGQITLAVKEF